MPKSILGRSCLKEKCSIITCKSNKHSDLRFYIINKNRNNLSDWIKNTKLSNEDIFNSKKKYFICENHFESKYFAGYRLVKTAYPSLFPQPYREQSEECE